MKTDKTRVSQTDLVAPVVFFSESARTTASSKYGSIFFWRKAAWIIFRTILLCGLVFVLIWPIINIALLSVKSSKDFWDPTIIWIPKAPTFDNFIYAFQKMNYPRVFLNTIVLSLGPTMLQLASCTFIGYGLARMEFRERNLIFALVLFSMVVPIQTIIIPMYNNYLHFSIWNFLKGPLGIASGGISLIDTYWPFFLPAIFGFGLRGGFFIYIFRQFFRGIPKELEECSYIDGCSPFRTYLSIIIPNSAPAIITVMLFSLVWHWNDFYEASIYLSSYEKYTVPIMLDTLFTMTNSSMPENMLAHMVSTNMAGIALAILPLIILYAIGQKYFIESVVRTGIIG